jgi:L-ascorbate metabolism protein UlaG (beta-lactamase superfamily)
LWGSFLLRTGAGLVYFAGDSGWGPHFAAIQTRLGAPRLALLPIGAYEPRWFMEAVHVTPDQAMRAHLALGARQSIGMHFGTFNLTDEGIDDPLRALEAARDAHGVPARDFATLDFGETRMFVP